MKKHADISSEMLNLLLFVSGNTANSQRAIVNAKRICKKHYGGHSKLTIIDIFQAPHVAADYQIVAIPTLLKLSPGESCRLIGDLSDEQKVVQRIAFFPPKP